MFQHFHQLQAEFVLVGKRGQLHVHGETNRTLPFIYNQLKGNHKSRSVSDSLILAGSGGRSLRERLSVTASPKFNYKPLINFETSYSTKQMQQMQCSSVSINLECVSGFLGPHVCASRGVFFFPSLHKGHRK